MVKRATQAVCESKQAKGEGMTTSSVPRIARGLSSLKRGGKGAHTQLGLLALERDPGMAETSVPGILLLWVT